MDQIKINGKTYTIKQISIRDYNELRHRMLMQDNDAAMEVVTKLTNIPTSKLKTLKYEEWLELFIAVQGRVNKTFRSGDQPAETRINIGDQEYGLVDLSNATIGEFMDLDIVISLPDFEGNMHKLLTILYRPFVESEEGIVFEEYDSNKCQAREEQFLDLPLSTAQKAIGFFLDFARASIKLMMESSIQEMTRTQAITEEQASRLKKIMFELLEDGSQLYSSSQAKTHSKSNGQQDYTTNSPLTISLGELINEKKRRDAIMNLFKNIGLN